MLGKTHLFYGVTAGALAAAALAHALGTGEALPLAEGLAAGVIGGLLPDLDEPGSMISNAPRILGAMAHRLLRRATRGTLLAPLGALAGLIVGLVAGILNVASRLLSRLVRIVAGGHREGSHWFPIWIGLSAGVYLLTVKPLGPWLAAGFCAGYLSHLAGDGCTKAGIPLIPRTALRLHLLPKVLRVRTGGPSETVFTFLYAAALGGLLALLYHMNLVSGLT